MVSIKEIGDDENKMETEKSSVKYKPTAMGSILDSFTMLMDKKQSNKITGGSNLISYLIKNKENEKELKYALKRLVRSLGSNQLQNRSGCFGTLVTLIKNIDTITVSQIIKLVNDELYAGTSSKSEVGDVAFGQILVCSAIFRSQLILRCDESEQRQVMKLLTSASTKKTYLSTATYMVLVDFVQQLNSEQFKSIVWCELKQQMSKPLADHTLDTLYFLMVIKQLYPDIVHIKKYFGVNEILCEDTIHSVCDKLMIVSDLASTNHPIYALVGKEIANSEHLKLFWTSGIESHLTKHNRNREIVAINLLTNIFDNMNCNYEVVPELLSQKFFKLFLDWFRGLKTGKSKKLHEEDDTKLMVRKQKNLLNTMLKLLISDRVDETIRLQVLNRLLFEVGDLNFSEVTGTAVVKTLMAKLNENSVKSLAKAFKKVLLSESKRQINGETTRDWYNYEKVKSAECLSYLVSHPVMNVNHEWRLKYMKLLMCFSFFRVKENNSVSFHTDLEGGVKASFYRCLNTRQPTIESLVEILRPLCSFITDKFQNEEIKEKLSKQFSEDIFECWNTLTRVTERIESGKKRKVDNVFLILLYQLGLYLFSQPKDVEMSKSCIEELASCYDHYKDRKKQKKSEKQGDLSLDEPEWIEVLIEVLLSILSHESSVLRSIVQCVFRLLWEYLTPSSIGQLVSVLDPDSDTNPLENDSDSESSDESSDEINGKEAKDEEDSKIDEDNESGIESDEDDEMKVPDQLRMAVQKALGNAATETDTESVDIDNMDEEEGKKLDEALSEAFKLLRQGKSGKSKKERKDKKTLTDFRIRVLDLIDIYLEKEPPMEICLTMLAPLMRGLEFSIQDSAQKDLQNRLRKTIKNLTKIRKFSSMENVTVDTLCDYLKATIDKGTRTHFIFQAMGDKISECGAFILHCLLKLQSDSTSCVKKAKKCPITAIFKEALNNFFRSRNCLLPSIFFHSVLQIEWFGNFELAKIIVENAFSTEVRQFRRNEALELLSAFYKAQQRIKPTSMSSAFQVIEQSFEVNLKNAFTDEKFVVKDLYFKLLNKCIVNMKKLNSIFDNECSVDLDDLIKFIDVSKKSMKQKRNESIKIKDESKVSEGVNKIVNGKNKKRKGEEVKANKKRTKLS